MRHHLDPLIQSRLLHLNPEKEGSHREYNDFLQWSIQQARTSLSDNPKEITPHMLVGRLLALNFAAIHTSTFTITNAIFDLVSSDPSHHYLEQLREEAALILAAEEGVWTKKGLSKMYKIDSALRESLRISSFLSVGILRKVIAKDGVTTPDGVHLPHGANVAIPTYGIHRDEKNYENPAFFDALRYIKQKDVIDATREDGDDSFIKKANLSMVSTSATFHPWGHGRHACPGRFFAANELKLLLAYIVLNYDIEPLAQRPRGSWVANVSLPPRKAVIRVRRRKDAAKGWVDVRP